MVSDPGFESGIRNQHWSVAYANGVDVGVEYQDGVAVEGCVSAKLRPQAVQDPKAYINTPSLDLKPNQYVNVTFHVGRRAHAQTTRLAYIDLMRLDYNTPGQEGVVVKSWPICTGSAGCNLRGTAGNIWQRIEWQTAELGGFTTAPANGNPRSCRDDFSLRFRVRWEGTPEPDHDEVFIDGVSARFVSWSRAPYCF